MLSAQQIFVVWLIKVVSFLDPFDFWINMTEICYVQKIWTKEISQTIFPVKLHYLSPNLLDFFYIFFIIRVLFFALFTKKYYKKLINVYLK